MQRSSGAVQDEESVSDHLVGDDPTHSIIVCLFIELCEALRMRCHLIFVHFNALKVYIVVQGGRGLEHHRRIGSAFITLPVRVQKILLI